MWRVSLALLGSTGHRRPHFAATVVPPDRRRRTGDADDS